MPRICYIEKNFSKGSLETIEQANRIITSYQAQGLSLTLRQLYYRFVAGALIPNKQSEYKRLGSIINDGRLAGLIDWDAIEDRGRNLQTVPSWSDPGGIIEAAARSYAIDLWQDQDNRVEVWVEKEALIGVVGGAAKALACPSFACKGYTSQSEMWRAGMRFKAMANDGQTPVVIHLGDHDPSGIDMTRDIAERLALFAGFEVEVRRVALNMDQVKKYSPPPNPAKLTDSRVEGYIEKFGKESWELDALEPSVLRDLIQDTIREYMDEVKYEAMRLRQEQERWTLKTAATAWEAVVEFLEKNEGDDND